MNKKFVGVLVLGIGVLACGGKSLSSSAESFSAEPRGRACTATFLAVSDRPMEISSGLWQFGVDAFLIGCQEDLRDITAEERDNISLYVASQVEERGLLFFTEHRSFDFRTRTAREINDLLDKQGLSDLLLIKRFSVEHGPTE